MLLLVINQPLTALTDSGLVEAVQQVLPARERLVAQWVKDEAGKLICRWVKE
jgi:hypothetical protein